MHGKHLSRWSIGLLWAIAALVIGGCSDNSSDPEPAPTETTPNILFVVLDDVGMDQMEIFGFGGSFPLEPRLSGTGHGTL